MLRHVEAAAVGAALLGVAGLLIVAVWPAAVLIGVALCWGVGSVAIEVLESRARDDGCDECDDLEGL